MIHKEKFKGHTVGLGIRGKRTKRTEVRKILKKR